MEESQLHAVLPENYVDGIPSFLDKQRFSPTLLEDINHFYKRYLNGTSDEHKVFFDLFRSHTNYIKHIFGVYSKRMRAVNKHYVSTPGKDAAEREAYNKERVKEQMQVFAALDKLIYNVDGKYFVLKLDNQEFGMQMFHFVRINKEDILNQIEVQDYEVSFPGVGPKKIVSAKKFTDGYFKVLKSENRWDDIQFLPVVKTKPTKKTLNSYVGSPYCFSDLPKPRGNEITDIMENSDLAVFLFFLKYCICGGVKEDYDYVLRRLACVCRKPGLRTEQAIIVSGLQGTGKTTLANLFCSLYGWNLSSMSTIDKTIGNFNPLIENKLFISLEEIPKNLSDEIYRTVLDMITSTEVTIHKKNENQRNCNNYMNVFATTNATEPILLSRNDLECRRFVALEAHKLDRSIKTKEFQELFCLDEEGEELKNPIKTTQQFWSRLRKFIWPEEDVKSPVNPILLTFLYHMIDVPEKENINAGYLISIKPPMKYHLIRTILQNPTEEDQAVLHFLALSTKNCFSRLARRGTDTETTYYWPGDPNENGEDFPFEEMSKEDNDPDHQFYSVVPSNYDGIKDEIKKQKKIKTDTAKKMKEMRKATGRTDEDLFKEPDYRELKNQNSTAIFKMDQLEYQISEFQIKCLDKLNNSFSDFCETFKEKLKISLSQQPIILKDVLKNFGVIINGNRLKTFPTRVKLAKLLIDVQKNLKNFFTEPQIESELDITTNVIKILDEEEMNVETPPTNQPIEISSSESEEELENPRTPQTDLHVFSESQEESQFSYSSPNKRKITSEEEESPQKKKQKASPPSESPPAPPKTNVDDLEPEEVLTHSQFQIVDEYSQQI